MNRDETLNQTPFLLDGQSAIITGAARGIGAAVAKRFAAAGATVFLWDVLNGSEVVDAISSAGGTAHFEQVDVTNEAIVADAVANAVSKTGRLDILINNAGVIRDRSFLKMSQDEWSQVLDVNLNSLFVVTRAVIPTMKAANYGRIVSASSVNGFAGAFGQTNYAATKAGVVGFTRSLAKEVGKYGITVNAVAPGFIETDMTASIPAQVVEAAVAQIPVGRIGSPMDMAYAYLFLASREAGFVSGATLHANGGAYGA